MLGFVIWSLVGLVLIGIGISDFFSKKAAGFWANIKVEKMTDVKKYNSAVGTLFIAYGVIFILHGLPMLGDNAALVLLSVAGVMFETIAMVIIYTQVISRKYREK